MRRCVLSGHEPTQTRRDELVHILAAAPVVPGDFADITVPSWAWVTLVAAIVVMLLFDLLVVHRKPHAVSFRAALIESGVWIGIGLAFGALLWWWSGGQAAVEYYTGYLIEKSLSVDNVFVWAVIFSYFGVPPKYQFRVLFWGVFGAIVMRAIFIFAGVALLDRFSWLLYVFGVFLLLTAVKMARHRGTEVHPENNPVLKLVRRVVPSTNEYDGQKLFTRRNGALLATPLFSVLVLVEATDVMFAIDSVPAILAVSREPFIVFSANAFAILGLRALYFALAGMASRFRYLDLGLAGILFFVGLKMLFVNVYHLPVVVSLGVIALILTVAIVASVRADRRGKPTDEHHAPDPAHYHASSDPEVSDPSTVPEEDRETLLSMRPRSRAGGSGSA
ncbi:MAG: TerC family protein [Nitriliruptorales bacterium]|nr:TerC family protein [Nitriliruptorales bacterium]